MADEAAKLPAESGTKEEEDEPETPGSTATTEVAKKKKKKKKASGQATSATPAASASAATTTKTSEASKPPVPAPAAAAAAVSSGMPLDMQKMLADRIKQLENPQEHVDSLESAMRVIGKKDYKFWRTQPVTKSDEQALPQGPVEPDKKPDEIRRVPLALPPGFEWDEVNVDDAAQLLELYTLLNENYVEDDDNLFRFDYSQAFLKWALQPPGWKKSWHAGVRASSSRKLLAFISAIPAHMHMNEHSQVLVEINFLCVHKRLRTKRLAPVLIQEITRRVHCEGIFQAVYTAGSVLPVPVAQCQYWHRCLDPKKLVDIRFSQVPRDMTMPGMIAKYRLPKVTTTPGLRPLQPADVPAVRVLLNEYLAQFSLAPVLTEEETAHWLLPRDNVIYSYVVESPTTHAVTDLISFYILPSTVVQHPTHKDLRAAYSYYNVARSLPLHQLMEDALILAKQLNLDVFNALDVMENESFLERLKFGRGDGRLHYYLYNYRLPQVEPKGIGLVLL